MIISGAATKLSKAEKIRQNCLFPFGEQKKEEAARNVEICKCHAKKLNYCFPLENYNLRGEKKSWHEK
jgi:hypothetical protein